MLRWRWKCLDMRFKMTIQPSVDPIDSIVRLNKQLCMKDSQNTLHINHTSKFTKKNPISICFRFMSVHKQGIQEHYKEHIEKKWAENKDSFGGRQKGKLSYSWFFLTLIINSSATNQSSIPRKKSLWWINITQYCDSFICIWRNHIEKREKIEF